MTPPTAFAADSQTLHDRDLAIFRAERDIDRLFRPLARAVGIAARRQQRVDALAYVLIMREVDRALDTVFGRFHGDTTAPFYRGVVGRCTAGWASVFRGEIEGVRQHLAPEPEVLRAIERETV